MKLLPPPFAPSLLTGLYSGLRAGLLACLLLATGAALAQAAAPVPTPTQMPAHQDPAVMTALIEQFLKVQTAALPGKASISVSAPDARSLPSACPQPEAFFPSGNRAWGKTTVGVRCTAPAWVRYIQAKVTVTGNYFIAAVPLTAGQPISSAQLTRMQGDLTAMPAGLVTDVSQAEGRVLSISIQAGAALRQDTLRSVPVIQLGQMVHVIASGKGFSVSTEARALGNAKEGQLVQLKTEAGKQISGIAKAGGLVEVVN